MPTFRTTDDVTLAYTDEGEGQPVVLVHGYTAPAASWPLTIDALLAAGFRAIAFDRRAHGESETPAHGQRMARHGRDLGELLAHLDLEDAVVVGASMGGNTIWACVDQFGPARLRAAVIVDQTPKMLNSADWPYGFYDYDEGNRDTYFTTSIPDPGRFPVAKKGLPRIARLLKAMDTKADRAFSSDDLAVLNDHAKADWRGAISRATVPVLFVAGAQSEFWPSAHAAASAALNPLVESVVIEKDGHAANIEQWREFNRVMLAFLERLGA